MAGSAWRLRVIPAPLYWWMAPQDRTELRPWVPWVMCDECAGDGVCNYCAGNGRVQLRYGAGFVGCPECAGAGHCPQCRGRGRLRSGLGVCDGS